MPTVAPHHVVKMTSVAGGRCEFITTTVTNNGDAEVYRTSARGKAWIEQRRQILYNITNIWK